MGAVNNDANDYLSARRAAAIERLTAWACLVEDVRNLVAAALREGAGHPRLDNYVAVMNSAVVSRPTVFGRRAAIAQFLVDILGEQKAEQWIGEVELSADQVDLIGLDSTGRDGNERFPYTIGNLTTEERQWLLELG